MNKNTITKFYTFNQNNSGGSFINSENEGIGEYVIIEAENADKANIRAENIGIYFNGCDNKIDCSCCGDRWYTVDNDDGTDIPKIYDTPVEEYPSSSLRKNAFIHYLNGKIKKVAFKES